MTKSFFCVLASALFAVGIAHCDGNCGNCVPKPGSNALPALCSACIGALAETALCSPTAEDCECAEGRKLLEGETYGPLQFLPYMIGDLNMAAMYPQLVRDEKTKAKEEDQNVTVTINSSPISTTGLTNKDCAQMLAAAFNEQENTFFKDCELILEVIKAKTAVINIQGDTGGCFSNEWLSIDGATSLPGVRSGSSCQNQCQKADDCAHFSFRYYNDDPNAGGTCTMFTKEQRDAALAGENCAPPPRPDMEPVMCDGKKTCVYIRRSSVNGARTCKDGAGKSVCPSPTK